MTTLQQLFGGVWNAERFAHVADVEVSEAVVLRVAQLALSGWTFVGVCGAGVELERDGEVCLVNDKGEVTVEEEDQ